MNIDESIAKLLFPPKCHFCGKVLENDQTDLCHKCRADAPVFIRSKRNFQLIAQWTAVWYYTGAVRNSIRKFKFYNARSYAIFFGRELAMKLKESSFLEEVEVLTWVPVSPLRKLWRGYDQSELLAHALGEELGMEPVSCLKKIRHTKPQSGIYDKAHRRANVFNVYQHKNPDSFVGKRVLLVDDVVTTGSTAAECAKALSVGGADRVFFAALAATPDEKTRR